MYVLPPIHYPGPSPPPGWYVKIGGGANDFFDREKWAETCGDLERWMASSGDEVEGGASSTPGIERGLVSKSIT